MLVKHEFEGRVIGNVPISHNSGGSKLTSTAWSFTLAYSRTARSTMRMQTWPSSSRLSLSVAFQCTQGYTLCMVHASVNI